VSSAVQFRLEKFSCATWSMVCLW